MTLEELNIPQSATTTAVRAIMRQLMNVKDSDGAPCLKTVRQGLYIPGLGSQTPSAEDTPACLVWTEKSKGVITANNFMVGELETLVTLYFLWYDMAEDGMAIQDRRQDYIEYVLSKLQEPDSGVTDDQGLAPDLGVWWWPTDGWEMDIDHTTAFKRIADFVQLPMHWYASRVDLRIQTNGLSTTRNA